MRCRGVVGYFLEGGGGGGKDGNRGEKDGGRVIYLVQGREGLVESGDL